MFQGPGLGALDTHRGSVNPRRATTAHNPFVSPIRSANMRGSTAPACPTRPCVGAVSGVVAVVDDHPYFP